MQFFRGSKLKLSKMLTLVVMLSSVFLSGLSGLPMAQAANMLTVTNTNNSGTGSLRDAISTAASGDTINFNLTGCPCTITLTSGELAIDKTLTIIGPTSGVTVSGNNASRIFKVSSSGNLSIQNLTIANGKADFIFANDEADLGDGGGIFIQGGTLTVSNSTFKNNATRGDGGAIAVGDLFNSGGTLQLSNSTIIGNSAFAGGGIFGRLANISITNSTITGNTASDGVGGIWNYFGSSTVSLKNTIVAGNTAPNYPDLLAAFSSQGYNVIGKADGSSGLTNGVNNDQVGSIALPLNPGLDPGGLKDNSGPTQTVALTSSSLAIDRVPVANCGATDQRGNNRQGLCDIGAFEFIGIPTPDITPPSTSASTTPVSPDGSNGWFKSDVTISLSASESTGGSGLASITYSASGAQTIAATTVKAASTSLAINTEGTTILSYYATDYAGNAETAHTLTIQLDKTPPTITFTRTNADGSTYTPGTWTNQTVTITYTCSDATSGFVAGNLLMSFVCAGITDDTNGVKPSSFHVSDVAGNSTSVDSGNIMIDKEPPTITASAKKADGSAYTAGTWTNQNVTVSFSCSDELSGLKDSCPAPVTVSTEGITAALSSGTISDNVGNTSSTSFGPIQIDKTTPTVTATPARAANVNGWYNAPVSFSFSGDDGSGSGIASCDTAKTYSGPDSATASVTGNCNDAAGNVGSATATFKYDATKPTVSYTGNTGTYSVDQTVSITCAASDNLSGIASTTCANISGPAYSFALGNNSFSATATDKAGNTGSGSTSFTVSVTFDSLCTLSANFSTDPSVDKGLCDKLAAAKAAAVSGDTKTKNNNLNAYRNQLSAQSGKALTKDQATILTNLSKTL